MKPSFSTRKELYILHLLFFSKALGASQMVTTGIPPKQDSSYTTYSLVIEYVSAITTREEPFFIPENPYGRAYWIGFSKNKKNIYIATSNALKLLTVGQHLNEPSVEPFLYSDEGPLMRKIYKETRTAIEAIYAFDPERFVMCEVGLVYWHPTSPKESRAYFDLPFPCERYVGILSVDKKADKLVEVLLIKDRLNDRTVNKIIPKNYQPALFWRPSTHPLVWNKIYGATFSTDGSKLLLAIDDGSLQCWHFDNKKRKQEIKDALAQEGLSKDLVGLLLQYVVDPYSSARHMWSISISFIDDDPKVQVQKQQQIHCAIKQKATQ